MRTPSARPAVRRALLVLAAVGAISAAAAAPAGAQAGGSRDADRAAVRQASLDYLEGFYEGDTARLVRSVHATVHKYGFARRNGEAAYHPTVMPYEGFMRYANGVKQGRTTTPPNAPKEVQLLDVQDQTAAVKVTAWWGTDYLLLARHDGRWMITHVLWQSSPAAAGR